MGGRMSRVFLVDDHALLREGLRAVLAENGHQVVGEAADVPSAIEAILRLAPDIVVLDLGLDGRSGLDLLERMRQHRSAARVVVFTMSAQPHHVAEAWRLGVAAYVLKGSPGSTVLQAIATAQRGARFIDSALGALQADLGGAGPDDRMAQLSEREREVMLLVVQGHSSAAIGERLHLSPKTVDTYRSRLMQKIGVPDLAALVRFAVRQGLIDPHGS
jgi:two-component system, NarL family, invasion response regulator UvrY